MTYLADVNVLLALAVAGHVHHATALYWFENSRNDQLAVCRITQMGFLRLLTNPQVMGANVQSARQAWRIYETMLEDSRIGFASEPAHFEALWRSSTEHSRLGPNFWTDACLGSFAAAAGWNVLTFDARFPRTEGARVRLLTPPRAT